MTSPVIIDFETRSRCPIDRGADLYASHWSTDIICMAVLELEGEQREWLWEPWHTAQFDKDLYTALQNADFIMTHNARFDQAIWECVGVDVYSLPLIDINRWYCTSAQARVNALPASLDDATKCLNASHRKNKTGAALIRKHCIPDKNDNFDRSPAGLANLGQYCVDDVRATADLVRLTRRMTPQEHGDWLLNERINDLGIGIDAPLAQAAADYALEAKEETKVELLAITNGELFSPSQHVKFPKWVLKHAYWLEGPMTIYVDGVTKLSLDKEHLTNILDQADAGEIKMPDMVYNALSVKLESSGSAVAKFKKMLDMSDAEDRVRGAFLYFGASTGRYTSQGLQLHNFKRDCLSVADTEVQRGMMLTGNKLTGAVLQTLGKMLRPTLIPEQGKVFVVGDWSGIESRGLPYLAGTNKADKKLDAFKRYDKDPENNLDNYQIAAADAGVKDRQVGKVIELSMGFGGAAGAFNAMAKNYGVRLPSSEVWRIVQNWRHNNSWAEQFWNALESAAKEAIRNPGLGCHAGRVTYRYDAQLMSGSLLCYLPGGTIITYPNARIESDGSITAIKANWRPKADDPDWPRYLLWRGLLAENCTQGFCATLLRDLISRVENVVLHVHDELAIEVHLEEAEITRDLIKTAMESPPSWAKGMPLKADPIILTRYGK